MEKLRLSKYFRKILEFFKFALFGKGWKSDLAFIALIAMIFIVIQNFAPYLFSVVYTNSMEHTNFDCNKYKRYNISCEDFEKFPFKNGINVGDLVIIIPTKYENLKVGDVVLYISPTGRAILHRLIQKNESFICIMGDNNPFPLPEECPLYDVKAIKGKAIFRIPYIGYFRLLIKRFFGF